MAISNAAGALVEQYLYGPFGALLSVTDKNGAAIPEQNRKGNPIGAFGMWLVEGVGNLAWMGGGMFFNKDTGKEINQLKKKLKALIKAKKAQNKKVTAIKKNMADAYYSDLLYDWVHLRKWVWFQRNLTSQEIELFYVLLNLSLTPKNVLKRFREIVTRTYTPSAPYSFVRKPGKISPKMRSLFCKKCKFQEMVDMIKGFEFTVKESYLFLKKGDFSAPAYLKYISKFKQIANMAGYREKKYPTCIQSCIDKMEGWSLQNMHYPARIAFGLRKGFKGYREKYVRNELVRSMLFIDCLSRNLSLCCPSKVEAWGKKGKFITFTPPK